MFLKQNSFIVRFSTMKRQYHEVKMPPEKSKGIFCFMVPGRGLEPLRR